MPLLTEGQPKALLAVSFDQTRKLDADERGFLLTLADVGAQALDRAALFESEQRARAEAEAAVHAQDEFLSIASHELRTPVAAVKATAQLAARSIQRGRLDPHKTTAHLQSISRAADRLARGRTPGPGTTNVSETRNVSSSALPPIRSKKSV